jgi:hypothetical protein
VNPGLHRRFAAALAPATEATEDEAGRLEDLRGALAVAGVSGTLRSALP